MTDLTIRPARAEDADAVFGLLTQFVTSYQPDRSAFERHFPVLVSCDQSLFLVASLDGEVIGYALGSFALTLYANGPVLELQELMVAPEHRRRGVGRRLVAAALERAVAAGRAEATACGRGAGLRSSPRAHRSSARPENFLSDNHCRRDRTDMETSITQFEDGGSVNGLITKCGLSASDLAQVETLADAVRCADGIDLKLNLPRQVQADDYIAAADQISELCYYDGGRLVGYAPLDGDDGELEVTVAVLPPYRRQGIFRLLLDAARREAIARGVKRLLLVSYPASLSGTSAAKALGLPYVSSEYRMEAEANGLPSRDSGMVRLVQADESNVTDLARLMSLTFGEQQVS